MRICREKKKSRWFSVDEKYCVIKDIMIDVDCYVNCYLFLFEIF